MKDLILRIRFLLSRNHAKADSCQNPIKHIHETFGILFWINCGNVLRVEVLGILGGVQVVSDDAKFL